MVRAGSTTTPEGTRLSDPLCGRLCHWLRVGRGCPEDHGRAAQAVCALWSAHSSHEDGVDRVQEAGGPPRDRPRERHLRLSRTDPLLVEVAPGFLGDQTQDSQEAPLSHQEGPVAVGSRQSSRALEIPVPAAVPEVTWALSVLWYPRGLPSAGGGPSLCGERVAVA